MRLLVGTGLFAMGLILASQGSGPASAQDAVAAEPDYFEVTGVADNDLLNVRATASPAGMVVARLPNGVRLKNLGCSEVKGNRWCKIADIADPKLTGWAAARYLIETALDDATAAALAAPEEESPTEDEAAPAVKAPAPTTGFDSESAIPCARYFGQPMNLCKAGVVRGDKGEAIVSVTWPDGGERTIRFRAGKPEGSNAQEELRFTREADLNMIRIGEGERYEISDALAFGG